MPRRLYRGGPSVSAGLDPASMAGKSRSERNLTMTDTLFRQVNYTLGALVEFIRLGQIGLPDIQRPFVWPNKKVRALFDSMYRGYPVGYLLFWQNGLAGGGKVIGVDGKQKAADLLIVDGQQRLTSLYAVTKGIPVLRENYSTEEIEIAFNPLNGTFEVSDAAIRKDKTYIPNISVVWGGDGLLRLVGGYIADLSKTREVGLPEQRQVEEAITRLHNLLNFPFTALELSKDLGEEQVAEVFVRINSAGKNLNQADFILTLMSVFWDEGRRQLESFCRASRVPSDGSPSPYNHYIQPDPDQLLRVAVGVAFRRGRLQHVYSILRGKDLETGEFSQERQAEQFVVLRRAQAKVLDIQHWHDYLKALAAAGFLGGKMISSNNNLLFTYVLYLLGRTEYRVAEPILRRAIARWFFMAGLTGRYTDSPESKLEFDLARFRDVTDAEGFVQVLDAVCDSTLTNDFWDITLPNDLATSSAVSPSLFAYYASLVLLDAQPLFSHEKVRDMLDPSVHAKRAAVERHHLFPKSYLKGLGVTSTRDTNQIANLAIVEWGDNDTISDQAPVRYLPVMREQVPKKDLERQYYWHALPDGWEGMEYRRFLEKRRELIAAVIRDGFARLGTTAPGHPSALPLGAIIASGEGVTTEFKSTLRTNLHTGQIDARMELGCMKTIAGFLNSKGGTLVVGVADDGSPIGLDADGFPDEDKMGLHLVNVIKRDLGSQFMMYIHPRFEEHDGIRVMVVECWPARSPVYVKDGKTERFFVRAGPSTAELPASQALEYIGMRFKP